MEYANLIKRLELHLPLLFSQLLPSQLEILWITLVAVILLSYKHPQEGWKRHDSTGGTFYSNICGEYCWENMSKYFKHTCARCFLKGYPPILEHCEADVIQLWTSWHQPTSQHCRSAAQEKRSRAMSRRWPQCKNNPIQRQRNIKSGDGTVTQTLEVWNCTRKTPYMHAWVGGAPPLSPRASSSELLCMKTLAWKSSMKLIPNGALLVETKMENIWRGVTITISEDAASTEGPLHIDSP